MGATLDNCDDRLTAASSSKFPSIEKAILLDICLGVPVGQLRLPMAMESGCPVEDGPDTFLFSGQQLAQMRQLHEQGQADIREAVDSLTAVADRALDERPCSVTDKPGGAAKGDPHDYVSLAKYYWPDEESDEGPRYMRRDGEVNPECYGPNYDYLRLVRLAETTVLLALAAWLGGDARHGRQAVALLRAWFLNEDTRQNPHFRHAQQIPGQRDGASTGLIEARFLIQVTEAVRLLEDAGEISEKDAAGIRAWYGDLLDWMEGDGRARRAGQVRNNIAFWYDLQRMVYADFCGRGEQVAGIVRDCVLPRLDEQVADDGALPRELGRNRPQDYVVFSLAAMCMIDRMGERHGIPVWSQETGDGKSFQVVHDWLMRAVHSPELVGALLPASESEDSGLDNLLDLGIQLRGLRRIAEQRGGELESLRRTSETQQKTIDDQAARLDALSHYARGHETEKLRLQHELNTLTGELARYFGDGRQQRNAKKLRAGWRALETERDAALERVAELEQLGEGHRAEIERLQAKLARLSGDWQAACRERWSDAPALADCLVENHHLAVTLQKVTQSRTWRWRHAVMRLIYRLSFGRLCNRTDVRRGELIPWPGPTASSEVSL